MIRWTPSSNLVAQLAHVGWGMALPLAFNRFHLLFIGALSTLAYAAVKEFVFDRYVEGQPFEDNFEDFCYYAIGVIGAVLVVML